MSTNLRPKISIFIATSIDGYIAKKDGGLDWLTKYDPGPDRSEDCGFKNFLSSVDTLVMGKNTYEIANSVDAWPYQGKRVIILSSSLTAVNDQAELYSGDISSLTNRLFKENSRHIYIDGGKTISQFMNADMVDDVTITIIPVVLGKGIPLFANILNETWFQYVSSRVYSNGLIQLKFSRK